MKMNMTKLGINMSKDPAAAMPCPKSVLPVDDVKELIKNEKVLRFSLFI